MGKPRISIVTPCYQSAPFLEQCILSVMRQNRANFEHIIVDGQSTDGTLDIIRRYEGRYPMRWISEKDSGMYDAISKGFRMAQGDIFVWLNSDDMYLPWATQVMERVCNTGVQWCMGIPALFDASGMQNLSRESNINLYAPRLLRYGWYDGRRLGWIQQESTFWTRGLYEKSGGLNPEYRYAGDYRLWCAFAQHAPLYTIDSVIGGFRIHDGQKSQNLAAYRAEQAPVGPFFRYLRKLRFYHRCERLLQDKRYRLRLRELPALTD